MVFSNLKYMLLIKIKAKCEKFAELIRESKRVVCLTGAGLSTSCGIPDFRGPNGVWTLEQKGLPVPESNKNISFENAKPSYTHYALVELNKIGNLLLKPQGFIFTMNS